MVIARILIVSLLLACSCAGPKGAVRERARAGAAELVEAERSFARAAADKGTREAFLEYIAADAVIFRPSPVKAMEWFEENTEGPGLLSWEPVYVEISSSRDLGYTRGPWRYRESAGDPEPVSSGHYVSIWKRRADGAWRLVLELGNVHPPVAEKDVGVKSRVATPSGPELSTDAALKRERELLLATDRLFSEESEKKGLVAAYMSFSTDDIYLLRMGELPYEGKTRVRKALMNTYGTMTWEPIYADVSSAGDLGYTYGVARLQGGGPEAGAETSSYARIWRIDSDGRWSVALDIARPSGVEQPEGETSPQDEGD